MAMDNKKTMVDFRAFLATFAPEYPVKKGYVAALILEGQKVVLGRVQKKIEALVPIVPDKYIWAKSLEANLLTFSKQFKKLVKGVGKQWDKLVELCNEIFVIKFKELPAVVSFQPTQPSALALPSELPVSDAPSTSYISAGSNRQRLRNECERCANTQRMYRSKLAELRKKLREQSRRHTLEMEKYASIRGAHKIIKMKDASRLKWRAKYFHLVERSNLDARKVDRLQIELEILKKVNRDLTDNLKEKDHAIEDLQTQLQEAPYKLSQERGVLLRKVSVLRRSVDTLTGTKRQLRMDLRKSKEKDRKEIHHLQVEYDKLKEKLEEAAKGVSVVQVKEGTRYNSRFRECVFKCLVSNVAVKRCAGLIAYIGHKLFAMTISDMPVTSSVAQMALEMGVLSDIQTGLRMHKSTLTTLSWDSTSLQGKHLNELHITTIVDTKQQSLTLSIATLSGAATGDYYEHIAESLTDCIHTYSIFYGLAEEEVKFHVLRTIKSTVTDRAAVNACVVRALEERLGMELIDLKCMVHPLDGLAQAARKVLATCDPTASTTEATLTTATPPKPKSECQTSLLLYNIAKLRYKQGTGDPNGFLSFLRENILRPNVIPRYVGNRLHVMFHMAGTVYHHRALLQTYLEKKCSQTGFVPAFILKQLRNKSTLAQLQALGLFGKIVTGPWMKVFYKNEDKLSNLEVVTKGKIKICFDFLKKIQESREYLFSCSHDVFGDELDSGDVILISLRIRNSATQEELYTLVEKLAGAFIAKLELQFTGLPDPQTAEGMLADTASAPVNNMQSERTLARVDALLRRAPNASTGFISAKVKACQNRTLEWMEGFSDEEQAKMVNYAISRGSVMRAMYSERDQRAADAVAKKRDEMAKKRDVIKKKKLDKAFRDAISDGVQLVDVDDFRALDRALVAKLDSLIAGSGCLVGHRLRHVWAKDDVDTEYIEIIRALKKKKVQKKDVLYLCLTSYKVTDPENQEDFSMPLGQFFADWVLGDISFVCNREETN